MIKYTLSAVISHLNLLFALLIFTFSGYAQVSLTSGSLTIIENFNGFSGGSTPANWSVQGSGSRGIAWNGTNQATGQNGGWYGNANMSFLGSGTATNGNATWLLQNNTGASITGFTLSFKAQMFRSNTGTPNIKVYWESTLASTNPDAGALSNALTSLTFSDATANISSGTTLTQTVSGVSIDNGSYIFIRFIHSGGANSDNLAWDDVSLTGITGSASCATPANLVASNINNTSANISWSAASGATAYQYALTTNATPPVSGTNTTALNYNASALTTGTTYYFHVRNDCGSGDFSAWSTTNFTTTGGSVVASEIKFMSYNLLNYPGSTGATRDPDFRTVIQSYMPDIVTAQEVQQAAGATSFLNNVLNYSSSTYTLGTFVNGEDSDNALYYKTGAFQFISNTPITTALRDISEFKLKHITSGDTLIIYSVHLKASSGSANEALRAAEVDSLRKRTNTFSAGKYFLVCGDFNFYGPEAAYQKLIQTGSNANGKFNDVVTMSGSTWNSAANAIHHTQSPRTTSFGGGADGGLDDRFDLVLFSDAIMNSGGFDVAGGTYKAYGNDGLHYNKALTDPPFDMYSQTLVTALHNVSDHLPVVVTLTHAGSVTPVNLIDFRGKEEGGVPHLKWSTASEVNSASFVIQRSFDAENWNDIVIIKAAGNSNSITNYSYTDRTVPLLSNTVYYRLKQIDFDGSFEIFNNTVTLKITQHIEDIVSIFPNPTTAALYVKLSGSQSSASLNNELRIYDLHGKLLFSVILKDELTTIDCKALNLTKGIYYAELEQVDGKYKFVVQ